MQPKLKRRLALAFVLLVLACGLFLAGVMRVPRESPMRYWQRQALAVTAGMTRAQAEKILPRQDFDGLLWELENLRFKHARALPPLRQALEFRMIHSDAWNFLGYEVASGVFVIIRYDLAGYPPGPHTPGKSTLNPGAVVLDAPVVMDTATGLVELDRRRNRL